MSGFEITLMCLALNVYKEARGEPVPGQHAVALVTLNRARARGDGDVCAAVLEPNQFSWTITDIKNNVLRPSKRPELKSVEWITAMQSAKDSFYMDDFTKGATHYHSVTIEPYWVVGEEMMNMVYEGRWGNHYFYEELDYAERRGYK